MEISAKYDHRTDQAKAELSFAHLYQSLTIIHQSSDNLVKYKVELINQKSNQNQFVVDFAFYTIL